MKEQMHIDAGWSGLHSDIEHQMKAGSACTMHRITAPPAPLKPIVIDRPWQRIAVDIIGPSVALCGYTVLTVMEYY